MGVTVGVDTHKHTHSAVAADGIGQILGQIEIKTTAFGYKELLKWAKSLANDSPLSFGLEGTGSYGAGLCEYLIDNECQVSEVEKPKRKGRKRGKSDTQDALMAAKCVLAGEGLSQPRSLGPRQALRTVMVCYDSCVKEQTRVLNQMHSLLICAPLRLRERILINEYNSEQMANRLVRMRKSATVDAVELVVFESAKDLARRAVRLKDDTKAHKRRIEQMARQMNPMLLAQSGVGPICAAKLLLGSVERFSSEAKFARANGTAPIPASSGKTRRYRLNRLGDRQLNYAIHMVALSRSRFDQQSKDYLEAKMAQGKNRKEAMRSLKRYVSRQLYGVLVAT